MGSLGATRGARSRAHVRAVGVAAVVVLFGLLTAAQAPPWRSPATGATRSARPAMPTRHTDVLVARLALPDEDDATADSLDDGSSDAVLPGTVVSPRVWSSTIATPPVASDPVPSAWWAATAARAPPDAIATAFGYLHPIG